MKNYKVGSNQFKKRTKKDIGAYMIGFLYVMVLMFFLYDLNLILKPTPIEASESQPVAIIVESKQVVVQVATPAATLDPVVTGIQKEIKEVFGKHADKAFLVLSCENSSLNPNAINTAGNSPAGSRDVGVFQINEYWQGVNAKFLLDPSINIRIAHKIFTDNGNSFERWSCARKLGIN